MVTTALSLSEVVLARRILGSGVGQRVREAAGVSMGEMAREMQVDLTCYSRWEAGTRSPRPSSCAKYLTVLRDLLGVVTPDDLELYFSADGAHT